MDNQKLQSIAPAPPKDPIPPSSLTSLPPRKNLTKNACISCRFKKAKCDGGRPSCSRCRLSGNVCQYEENGRLAARLQRISEQLNRQQDRLQDLEAIFEALQNGTDEQAAGILAYVRVGEPFETIVSHISSGTPETSAQRLVVFASSLLRLAPQYTNVFLDPLFDRTEWLNAHETNNNQLSTGSLTPSPHTSTTSLGNLLFSSSITANHCPTPTQQDQFNSLFAQRWNMMTANDCRGAASVTTSFSETLQQGRAMISAGAIPEEITGTFPTVAALFDQDEFERCSMISKWAARFVYSSRHEDNSFTSMAAMWAAWHVMRWMVNPQPQTYAAIPDWLRPTELQLVIPHVEVVECVAWPYLRDFVIQNPAMQDNLQWLAESSSSMRCAWAGTREEALVVNEITGHRQFTEAAEASVRKLSNWSLAPSIRAYIPNIDRHVTIRTIGSPDQESDFC
ncbi:uncharacterized protein BCR38DRAFT_461796 [Pseudomassariella vexata]|uniref:Zn(2)-C6 fungal-type domain-containing protein n=1 Tax=Pseudomassariella vexata TaxID=1141098 RepID=A0A1Y2DAL0_9PEZI|nr:uncharacterized protein BCR38DRAFT_461796 [Pseudomassariella vexata]ORY56146.1 hypothetical protein BCR38DRAFT_461796 [Pseudomassariella vexata]